MRTEKRLLFFLLVFIPVILSAQQSGSIAYVRGSTEIRSINADGTMTSVSGHTQI